MTQVFPRNLFSNCNFEKLWVVLFSVCVSSQCEVYCLAFIQRGA